MQLFRQGSNLPRVGRRLPGSTGSMEDLISLARHEIFKKVVPHSMLQDQMHIEHSMQCVIQGYIIQVIQHLLVLYIYCIYKLDI